MVPDGPRVVRENHLHASLFRGTGPRNAPHGGALMIDYFSQLIYGIAMIFGQAMMLAALVSAAWADPATTKLPELQAPAPYAESMGTGSVELQKLAKDYSDELALIASLAAQTPDLFQKRKLLKDSIVG